MFNDDLLEIVIAHRDGRIGHKTTNGLRHVSEIGYDDLTCKVRRHFDAIGQLELFDSEVMSLGDNVLQSPIERAVFSFLLLETFGLTLGRKDIAVVLPGDGFPIQLMENCGVAICPQHQVEGYFLDFGVFVNTGTFKLAFDLECDGLEFHGQNNSQIDHDYRRDIAISKSGFQIYRIPGRKINAHPLYEVEKFSEEVIRQISALERQSTNFA